MSVDHQVSGPGIRKIVAQGLQVVPAVGTVNDSLRPVIGKGKSALGVFPSRQHSSERVHWLGRERSAHPSGSRLNRPIVGGAHVVGLKVEVEVSLVEPKPQLSGRADLPLDFTGFETKDFIVRQDRVQGS